MESITLNLCLPYNLYSPSFFPSHPHPLQLAGAVLFQASWPLNVFLSWNALSFISLTASCFGAKALGRHLHLILTPLLASRDVGQVILKYFILFYIVTEKAMATHSSTLAWKIPWMEEPGRLQSMGSLRGGHDFTFTFTFHFHALEKEMATHSSVLAWRIPGTVEPGGLPSMGSHRIGHD